MKKTFLMGLFISLIFLNGCGEEEDANTSGLSVSVVGSAILIPADTSGCSSLEAIAQAYFSISNLSINWVDTESALNIAYIKIEATGSGLSGDYNTILGGDEIGEKLIYFDDAENLVPKIISNGIIPAATSTVKTRVVQARASCSLKFGGVAIADENKNFTATATVTVQGIAVGIKAASGSNPGNIGQEKPVRAKAKFDILFNLN